MRARDILHEIEGRLGPLRAQAERARRFVEIRDRLRAIESDLLIVDLRFADYELTAARQAREEEQAAVAKHAARIAALLFGLTASEAPRTDAAGPGGGPAAVA